MKNHIKTTWIHLRRSPYQAIGASLIMFLTFFVISVFALLAMGSEVVLRYFETRPQVIAFFKDNIANSDIENLKSRLDLTGKIKELKYVSKDEALQLYRQQNQADPQLLEMVTADILPASLEVSTQSISDMDEIAAILKNEAAVSEVIYQEDIVKSMQSLTYNFRRAGAGLIGFFTLVSLMVVLIVVGIKAAVRREEIGIMKLIGASGWYIRLPFIFEGIFYGLVGALTGWGAAYIALLYATPFLVQFLAGISILPVPALLMLELLGGEILLGIIIGLIASLLAVKRYLK